MYHRSFAETHSFQKRYDEATRIREKYPNRVPIICEKDHRSLDIPDIDRKKIFGTSRFKYCKLYVCN